MSALILNIPYSSCSVPPAVGRGLGLGDEQLRLEHWRLSDPPLAELVRAAALNDGRRERPVLAYPFSPLVADPLGAWAAELGGPGAGPAILPRSTAGKAVGWTEKDRTLIFSRTVEPYYRRLEEAVEEALRKSPLVVVLTVRSFSSIPLDFEKSRIYPRPQVVVGSEPGSTPEGLAFLAFSAFRAFHWWVERSWPQRDLAWLPPSLRGRVRVKALGLSLCRGLYMDEQTGRPGKALNGTRRILGVFFNLLEQEIDRVARIRLERARAGRKPSESSVIKAGRN